MVETAPPASDSISAPAKVNLTLEILARRDDGYHGVRSVMVPVGWYDRLRWEASDRFEFVSSEAALQDDNIVVRACEMLGLTRLPLRFTLEKTLATGGGLGGGSSDAAAVLRAAMNGAFGQPEDRDWRADARALGSDVPFFLVETAALVEGTGERVTALGRVPAWWIVLYHPDVHVATAEAYARLDAERDASPVPSRVRSESASLRVAEALQRGDFAAVVEAAQNDFEPVIAALHPAIAAALVSLRSAGAPLAMLSGSGACVFALAGSEDAAQRIAAASGLDGERTHVVPLVNAPAWR